MPENLWLYGFISTEGLETTGIVIADTREAAKHRVYDMYNDFGTEENELDKIVVWKAVEDRRYNPEYSMIFELEY